MAASIHDILRPRVVTKMVSQIAASTSSVLNFMGMQPGGPNERLVGGRSGEFHIFNNVRAAALIKAPGTAAAKRANNPVGRVPFVFPRFHESTYILSEAVHNLAKLGLSDAQRDEAGADYIKKQLIPVGQRLANARTAMIVGMLRGAVYAHQTGDAHYVDYTSSGAAFTIDYQMPAANKTQLDMLGDGSIIDVSWDNSNANIPLHLGKIDAAFQELSGTRLRHVHCGQVVWNHIITNDYVASGAGIANTPFETFERVVGSGPDGTPLNDKIGKIKAVPWVDFHVSDEGLDLGVPGSETFTKHWGDTFAAFMGDVNPVIYEMMLGTEPIAERDGGPEMVKVGAESWSRVVSNPTGHEVFSLDNCLPSNAVPKANAFGTVVF